MRIFKLFNVVDSLLKFIHLVTGRMAQLKFRLIAFMILWLVYLYSLEIRLKI